MNWKTIHWFDCVVICKIGICGASFAGDLEKFEYQIRFVLRHHRYGSKSMYYIYTVFYVGKLEMKRNHVLSILMSEH